MEALYAGDIGMTRVSPPTPLQAVLASSYVPPPPVLPPAPGALNAVHGGAAAAGSGFASSLQQLAHSALHTTLALTRHSLAGTSTSTSTPAASGSGADCHILPPSSASALAGACLSWLASLAASGHMLLPTAPASTSATAIAAATAQLRALSEAVAELTAVAASGGSSAAGGCGASRLWLVQRAGAECQRGLRAAAARWRRDGRRATGTTAAAAVPAAALVCVSACEEVSAPSGYAAAKATRDWGLGSVA